MKVVVLPISRSLFRFLNELERGDFGAQLISIVLTGFIQLMEVRNFDLKAHLGIIDDIDGIFGFESRDLKLDLSISIARMSLSYRNYFSNVKCREIKVHRYSYNKRALRFSFEVNDERN